MAEMTRYKEHQMFPPFDFGKWRAVDDRVRGGSSCSHLDPVKIDVKGHVVRASREDEKGKEMIRKSSNKLAARFWGHLDIKTLGGAGFASQVFRYSPHPVHFPRTKYAGIVISAMPDPLNFCKDTNQPSEFTVVIKTSPTSPILHHLKTSGSPRAAQLVYESRFILNKGDKTGMIPSEENFYLPWNDFKATYRGREINPEEPRWAPLDTSSIYEVSLMCRSNFGKQEGDFGLIITGISAWEKDSSNQETESGCLSVMTAWVRNVMGWDRGIRLEEGFDEKKA
nr:hypothetical protein L203_00538 [Cryptococcus depauperatus CBS 7841]